MASTCRRRGVNSDIHGSAELRPSHWRAESRRALDAAKTPRKMQSGPLTNELAQYLPPAREPTNETGPLPIDFSAHPVPHPVDAMLEALDVARLCRRASAGDGDLSGAPHGPDHCSSKARPVSARPRSQRCCGDLGRRLIRLQCYEGLDVSSAVYEWNSAEQIHRDPDGGTRRRHRREQLESDIFARTFLIKRPLLQAMETEVAGPPVLLIDVLDRADEAFEAYLLELLTRLQRRCPNGDDGGRLRRSSSPPPTGPARCTTR